MLAKKSRLDRVEVVLSFAFALAWDDALVVDAGTCGSACDWASVTDLIFFDTGVFDLDRGRKTDTRKGRSLEASCMVSKKASRGVTPLELLLLL